MPAHHQWEPIGYSWLNITVTESQHIIQTERKHIIAVGQLVSRPWGVAWGVAMESIRCNLASRGCYYPAVWRGGLISGVGFHLDL